MLERAFESMRESVDQVLATMLGERRSEVVERATDWVIAQARDLQGLCTTRGVHWLCDRVSGV
jgi:metal-responsive CopG/Arc/MetJ family transcriptional regulator